MKIDPTLPAAAGPAGAEAGARKAGGGFADMLEHAVEKVNRSLLEADDLRRRLAAGEPVDVARTMIATTKAGLSLRLLLQVRNKVVSAYEEIMRIQP
ncbi:flagellar hook-basal body complex protein FliE [Dissulfurirhabdus thermomarina]|uniref:Flagellar hook-basal body complex protein FliE n=1 Tax=Dissulfurirhabdus thermomarina TaxID=1765737 RepID=A0A6N9TS03_DISTH|nr:flagellar hook-basal body complex protein FliE [Dissulfurirhabdus thermomarina]NDY42883.1 flagellar hook-basal body complex protein FliE [Dissulfurirhabdus thermomarina]NMX23900.1 flagellar hook-basal body complex protein FliE [Dissulfurirhabdus thermomarina]